MEVKDLKCGITDIDKFLRYDEQGNERSVRFDRFGELWVDGEKVTDSGSGCFDEAGVYVIRVGGTVLRRDDKQVTLESIYGVNSRHTAMPVYSEDDMQNGNGRAYGETLILDGDKSRIKVTETFMENGVRTDDSWGQDFYI